jgi:hypothetical protein
MTRLAVAAALLIVAAAACSSPTPSESAPAVMATSRPASTPTAAPVILPADAPLKPSDCGWQASTPLAFAGWATVTDLDASQLIGGNPLAHVYALVSRDPVELHPMIGSPMLAHGFCAIRQDGLQTESGVRDDWTFHGIVQQPLVTCSAVLAISCVRATLAVLDAVAKVGHPATRIAFYAGNMCMPPWEFCSIIVGPAVTQNATAAIVSFAGTDQQAYLYVFWLADGSISSRMMRLATPPPGASPFP